MGDGGGRTDPFEISLYLRTTRSKKDTSGALPPEFYLRSRRLSPGPRVLVDSYAWLQATHPVRSTDSSSLAPSSVDQARMEERRRRRSGQKSTDEEDGDGGQQFWFRSKKDRGRDKYSSKIR